jgi:hypothetical protein
MENQISGGLKITFLIHLIVGGIFGLALLFVPTWWMNLSGWAVADPEPYRVLGAAILGFAASSWWAYREATVEKVLIIVKTEIVWTILAALVFLYGLLAGTMPAAAWINFIIMAAFAVAFIVFRPQE